MRNGQQRVCVVVDDQVTMATGCISSAFMENVKKSVC